MIVDIVICARCGQRMTVGYHHPRGQTFPEYLRQNQAINTASTSRCQTIPGANVDQPRRVTAGHAHPRRARGRAQRRPQS